MGAAEYLVLAAVVAVLAVAVVVGLVVTSRRRSQAPTPAPTADQPTAPAAPVDETVEAPAAPAAPTLERPEGTASRLVRLRQRLAGSQGGLGRGLLALLSRDRLDEDTWESIEDTLITADIGVGPATEVVERLRTRLRVQGGPTVDVRSVLRDELLTLVDPTMDRTLHLDGPEDGPAVVLVVGVNGAGKTTSVGKIARVLVADGKSVVMGAADTFRAAATEQLTTWGQRVGVEVVAGPEGSDPASVAFESVRTGVANGTDVVLVDTAGRLQNKAGLMDELGKVKRVIEKQLPVREVLLVLDATTGQNGMVQARVFGEVVDVSGIALTKLDGTAKGGIVLAIEAELGIPVKLIGVGESAADLLAFEPESFVAALLE